jgi:toxin ParE1/3/4
LIRWWPIAIAQREEQIDYISADNPIAAARQDDLIDPQVEQLLQQPRLGRPGRVKGTRELVISRTPFIAVYRIRGRDIDIVHLLHGAQQWPPEK